MTKLNQIQSFETWQEAFDRIKRSVDEYHTKFWEELEKMTKIDETKQYKFSEIIAMLENKELPVGTVLINAYYTEKYPYVVAKYSSASLFNSIFEMNLNVLTLNEKTFGYLWTIKLPKEDKYYLKAPKGFNSDYLNLNSHTGSYFLAGTGYGNNYQTQFTQSEISAMPFKTSFFEKIKVEDEK